MSRARGGPPAALLWSLALCRGKIGVGLKLSCLHSVSSIQSLGPGWRGAANIRVSEDCAVAEWKVTVTVTAPTLFVFPGAPAAAHTPDFTSTFSTHSVSTRSVLVFYPLHTISYLQGESKKSGISKIMGISSCKYIRKGHIGGVLENSGYLLPDGH